jgi:hypothetical protein
VAVPASWQARAVSHTRTRTLALVVRWGPHTASVHTCQLQTGEQLRHTLARETLDLATPQTDYNNITARLRRERTVLVVRG